MRMKVIHDIDFVYGTPATALIVLVRLTPRGDSGQFVHDWRLDLSVDTTVQRFHDPFGNLTHTFSLDAPISEVSVTATGTVETEERNGIVGETGGRVPPDLYLRDTPPTALSPSVRALAATARSAARPDDDLDFAHRLNMAIADAIRCTGGRLDRHDRPEDTLEAMEGTAADLAHLHVAACRAAGVPARLVCGYRAGPVPSPREGGADATVPEGAFWCWSEAFLPRLGWVAFDPSTGLCVTEGYVRIAVGPDLDAAAPLRHFATGGGDERIVANVRIRTGKHATGGRVRTAGRSTKVDLPPGPVASDAGTVMPSGGETAGGRADQ